MHQFLYLMTIKKSNWSLSYTNWQYDQDGLLLTHLTAFTPIKMVLTAFQIVGLHGHNAGEAHDHEEEDKTYVWRLLVVVVGIYSLFFFENIIKVAFGKRHVSY